MCSIRRPCYLLQPDWEWSKVAKSGVFGVKSVISVFRWVEVWCTQSFVPRGVFDAVWQLNTENTKITEITTFTDISDNSTDVLTCLKVVFSGVLDSFAILHEPAGFTCVFMNINGIFRKHPKWHRYDTVVDHYWPPGDEKRSVLTRLKESGRKPPRTEMRESHISNMTTPKTPKFMKITEINDFSTFLTLVILNRGFNVLNMPETC